MNRRGQALPLIGLAALVLVSFAGFAVDVGYHQYQQRVQQTATDSAALAGARELASNSWKTAAQQDATLNGYTDNEGKNGCDNSTVGLVCVLVDNPPVSPDAYAGNTKAVEVRISVNHPTFFERVAGYTTATVVTKAVAVLKPTPSQNCVFVLNGSQNANFNGQTGGGVVTAPDCGMVFNGGANFHGATVTAGALECVKTCSGGTYTSATPEPAAPASDPCNSMAFCATLAASTPGGLTPSNTCSSPQPAPSIDKSGNVEVLTGCYNGLNLAKATNVTFDCGFYVITGTLNIHNTNKNAPPITVNQKCGTSGSSGVTFYVTGNGAVDMQNDLINLSAPTTGDYSEFNAGEQNVFVYQTPTDANTLNLQSASCSGSGTCATLMNGLVYAPSANLNYNKATTTTSGDVLIVAGELNANGGLTSLINAPGGPPAITVLVPVLGE